MRTGEPAEMLSSGSVTGKASGALKGGRHVRLRELTTHSNLLLSILHKAGAPADSIGDSTGPIAGL